MKLKPCLKCRMDEKGLDGDGQPLLYVSRMTSEIGSTHRVRCRACGSAGPIGSTEREAVKLWNVRIPDPLLTEALDTLRNAIDEIDDCSQPQDWEFYGSAKAVLAKADEECEK